MDRLLHEKIKRELVPQPLKFKKSYFTNNAKLKDKIHIGEPFFKREVRPDKIRAGYTGLLDKLQETQLFMN